MVEITTAGQNNTINDEKVLDGAKRIVAIEAYRVADVSISPEGKAVVNNTAFAKGFLTLATGDSNENCLHIPLTDLCKKDNAGQLFHVDLPPIAATKSKIFFGNTAGIVATEVVLLGIHYED